MLRSSIAGVTLLELLIVVVIIGILTVFAVAQYFLVVERSRVAEAEQILAALRSSELRYRAANPEDRYFASDDDLSGLDVQAPVMQGWGAPFVPDDGPGADICTIRTEGANAGGQLMMDLDTGRLCVGGGRAQHGLTPGPTDWGITIDAGLCGGC